jgi:alpha-D-xyloside xylohydrolase
VFRLHGERSPYYEREQEYRDNIRLFSSAQDNEVWTWGEENYEILKSFLFLRERLRPYIRECMKEAHKKFSDNPQIQKRLEQYYEATDRFIF